MQKIESLFCKIGHLPAWSTLFIFLGVLVLAFGILIPWQGYGWDEWHFIYYSTRGNEGLIELFNYDGHPQAVWSYILTFNLLGYEPLVWHVFAFFWRWLAVCVFWWVFHLTWPDKRVQTFSAALFFAIYPFFTLQILPLSFFEVWFSFFVLGLSFAFSLLALRHPARFGLFLALAILFKFGHVMTKEYTWFTELMHPLLLWFAMSADLRWREKARRVFLHWLPFFLIFFASSFWRAFLLVPTRKTFQVSGNLYSDPLGLIVSWFLNGLPDVVLVLFTSWFSIFAPGYFWLADRLNLVLLGLAAAAAGGLFLYLRQLSYSGLLQEKRWAWQAVIVGIVVVVTGVLPYYIGGYAIFNSKEPINSRFALGLLPGAALFVVGLFELLVSSQRARLALLALLAAFSMTWHVRYSYDARNLWAAQSELLRQLTWRAPGLLPGAVLYQAEPFVEMPDSPAKVLMVADFSYAMALNALYQVGPQDEKLSYWYHSDGIDILNRDEPFVASHATTTFTSIPGRELYFYFAPQEGTCLRILQPQDAGYRHYPESVRAAAAVASLAAIDPSRPANTDLMSATLNIESNEDRWCYYYQKAELARQYSDWNEIIVLWENAAGRDLRPRHGMEFLPFIEAYVRLDDFETAMMLSKRANQISRGMNSPLCSLWRDAAGQEPVFEQVKDIFDCAP